MVAVYDACGCPVRAMRTCKIIAASIQTTVMYTSSRERLTTKYVPCETANLSGLEDADLLPSLPKRADRDKLSLLALDVFDVQELVLLSEGKEVRE